MRHFDKETALRRRMPRLLPRQGTEAVPPLIGWGGIASVQKVLEKGCPTDPNEPLAPQPQVMLCGCYAESIGLSDVEFDRPLPLQSDRRKTSAAQVYPGWREVRVVLQPALQRSTGVEPITIYWTCGIGRKATLQRHTGGRR